MPVDGLATLRDGLPEFHGGADVLLDGIEIMHVFFEAPGDVVQALLPPALHPTIPGAMYVTFIKAARSPWGPFTLAEVRLAARLREKPRAFLVAAAVHGGGRDALAAGWGTSATEAEVELRRWYDRVEGTVTINGDTVLRAELLDPEPIPGATLQFGPLANPALVGDERRVVLVDPVLALGDDRQRGVPRIPVLEGAWWGAHGLRPTLPIGAYYATGDMHLPAPTTTADPEVRAGGGVSALT